jgi:pantoate--beta-alanine ligase
LKIVHRPADFIPYSDRTSGFVPTMGALHQGHLDLVRASKSQNEATIVSIFVNPTQFGPTEDLAKYPRTLEQDLEHCRSCGVDQVFVPQAEDMFPSAPTMIHVPGVTSRLEGPLKLFNIVRPSVAYFGLKDLQQCSVIQKMVVDLDVPIRLSFVETRRESDGLAMSSRNRYLSDEQRAIAPQIYRQLSWVREQVLSGSHVLPALEAAKLVLSNAGFTVDYLTYIDRASFEDLDSYQINSAIVFAGKIGNTRLIDNVLI